MLASQFLIASFAAVASVTALVVEEELFASLLKRQEPGTPQYDCHSACGTAITLSRGADPCTDESFVTNYNNCLACAGPDNVNIWRYYGGTLSTAGSSCGFETEPASGGNEAAASSSATPVSTSTGTPALTSGESGPDSASITPATTTSTPTIVLSSSTPSPSNNATANTTTPVLPEQSVNAAAGLSVADSVVFGAAFIGAILGM